MNESNVSGDKEKLIREAFELWTQIGYGKFHAEYFNDPETIRREPNPVLRSQQLRNEWQRLSEPYFEDFRAEKAPLSIGELSAQVERLRSVSDHPWDAFQRLLDGPGQPPKVADPMVQELLSGIHELVSTSFVDSLFPAAGLAFRADSVATTNDGEVIGDNPQNAMPFAALTRKQKWDVIESYIDWEHFRERGLGYLDAERISSNVRLGKPPDRWLEGTSYMAPAPQPIADRDSHPKETSTGALRDQLFAPAQSGNTTARDSKPQPQPEHPHERRYKR